MKQIRTTKRKRIPFSLSLLTISILSAQGLQLAHADEDKEGVKLDSLVVTGEKIDKKVKDTTTAVTIFNEDDVASGEAENAMELVTKVPNIVTDSFGNVSIRGVSGGGAATGGTALVTGARARVTTVVDGTIKDWSGYNFTPSTLWDIEQVEVLRGPQSTTQGASAIGGAVVINTKDPTFENEAAVRIGLESYRNGHIKPNLALMASGPLIDNELAYRLAADGSRGQGWMNYENDNSFDFHTPNLSSAENLNVRGKLLWEPSDIPELSMKLTINHHKNEGEHASFTSNTDEDIDSRTLDLSSSIARVQDSEENSVALDVDYELASGITNALHISHTDSDIYADGYGGVGPGLVPLHYYDIQQRTTTFENRLVFNEQDAKLTGVLGLYISKKDSSIDAEQFFAINTGYTTDTTAAYGEATYAFTEKTKATAGIRIEHEDIDKTGSFGVPLFSSTSGDVGQDDTNTYYLPKFSVTHALTDITTFGASVSKGYSPGGTGLNLSNPFTFYSYDYDSEKVKSYELSSKSDFGNGNTINASVFYNDYTDYQALSGFEIVNVDESHIYGFELEGTIWPTENLELWGSIGLLKSEIDKNASNEGNKLSSVPQNNLAVGFTQYIGNNWSFGGDVNYVGHFYSNLENSHDSSVGDATITNIRAQYVIGKVTVDAYVKNLTNEDAVYYRTGALAQVGQTRTVGVSGTYRWD